jgi:DNA primase
MIPQSFITDLLARADAVEIVGRYVQLKKAGVNYKGLCPFHGEKSPSFTVSPTKQFYHCFGCGAHGTAISFLMEHTGLSFVDAVKDLASMYGLKVPEERSTPEAAAQAQKEKDERGELIATLDKANDFYRQQLKGTERAIGYLKGRGLTGQIAARYELGYALDDWRGLAKAFTDYEDKNLSVSGLVVLREAEGDAPEKRYDRLRDRITFPIRDTRGDLIGFGGRVLDKGEPKYLNSPETPVFHKGEELYGLFEARQAIRKQGYVLVVEGYMDVVALAQGGFENAVATLGTACTPMHVQKLFRHSDSVIFSFDGDTAGQRAAKRALEAALPHATDTRVVRFLFLPKEHDPDSYVRELGAPAFERAVGNAMPLSTFFLQSVAEGCAMSTAEGRSQALMNAKPLLPQLPDGSLRVQLTQALAELTKTDVNDLKRLIFGKSFSQNTDTGKRSKQFTSVYSPKRPHTLKAQETAIAAILSCPEVWDELSEEQQLSLCTGESLGADIARWFAGLGDAERASGRSLPLLEAALHNGQLGPLAKRVLDQALLDAEQSDTASVRRALIRFELDRLIEQSQALSSAPDAVENFDELKRLSNQQQALRAHLQALTHPNTPQTAQ